MNSSPAPSPTHEYRMKVSRSSFYLLLAALLILASIPLATRNAVGMDNPMVFGRVAVGALLMFCGFFMVATVVRSRLIIEGSQIRFRIVFREEVFPLSEIEGFRTISTGPASHRVSRRVICVKDRSEPIEIVQFDQDDFLQTWLQQLPNLDHIRARNLHSVWRCSMRLRWKVVVLGCVALICGSAIIWHFVHAALTARQLANEVTACRVGAERGDAKPQFKLGSMYYHGKGVPQNYHEALDWYRKAAAQGNTEAEYAIGYLYYHSYGVAQDYIEAVRWYREAADHGYAWAQDSLGVAYYQGNGVAKDYGEAVRWFRKAADQGDSRGQYDLGLMYYDGKGVPQDRAEASRLFHEAAAQGDEKARRAIGWNKAHVPAISKIVLPLKLLASLFFGVAFLKPGQSRRTRAQIATGLAALLLMSGVVLDLFWYSYVGHLQSSTTLTALYLVRHLVGGAIIAMLAFIVHAKSAKIVLIAAAALFLGFTLFGIVRSELRHVPLTIRFLCFVGLPIGMSIPSAILLWLDRKRSGQGLNGKGDVAVPVTTE